MAFAFDRKVFLIQGSYAVSAAIHYGVDGPLTVVGPSLDILDNANELRKMLSGENPLKPNPLFVADGFGHGMSKETLRYLKLRRIKNIAGKAANIVGSVTSPMVGGHSVPQAVVHGAATASSAIHLARIEAIGEAHDMCFPVQDWCKILRSVKSAKASIRGIQTAGGIIPAANLPATIAAAVAKASVQMTFKALCLAVAADLQYAAFEEGRIKAGYAQMSGVSGGPDGPATQIIREIFTQRGPSILVSRYDVEAFIAEPAGWMAIGDKLTMI